MKDQQVICKLVAYHDLIGDIIGKGRRIEELIDVVEDERDLNMLLHWAKPICWPLIPHGQMMKSLMISVQVKDKLASKTDEE